MMKRLAPATIKQTAIRVTHRVGSRMTLGIVALAMLLTACQTPPVVPDELGPPATANDRPTPSYRALVERYNKNVEPLDRLWASTEVHLRWEDREGKQHREHGDGTLIIVRPRKVAMTVGKLGNTILWAGSNEHGYWLFDKRDKGKVFFGRYRYIDKACSRSLPMPIQPKAVPYLLGTMPLDADAEAGDDAVQRYQGFFLIEPPGLNVRLWLDPTSAMPKRVDLLDEQGNKAVSAILREPWPVDLEGVSQRQEPMLAHETQIYVHGDEAHQQANVRIELKHASDGKARDQINERAFDFDTLVQHHQPAERIDLDADCFDTPPGLALDPSPTGSNDTK